MIRHTFAVLFCMMGLTDMYGQQAVVAGFVADSADKAPIAGVIIQMLDENGKVLSYTLSKSDGRFSLPHSGDGGSVIVFKSIGYREHKVSVSGNKSPLEILLAGEPVQLRNIVVKAPDILMKNDTLVYNVQKYAGDQDRTIADVLKKMPGIEVAETGQIKYNGTPINKFYIEGNDLLEGRYGLASNNISHNDVQNVEIMENHQPIRALQGIDHSEQAGLNLRLKESAKLRWSGIANAGAGFSPMLYDASLFAMRIAGKQQSMETVRINNTGWNPASQSLRHTFDNLPETTSAQSRSPEYISAGEYATPLDDRQTRFNRSCLLNSTSSVKLKNGYDLKAGITYERDALEFTRSAYTDYFDNSLSPLTETEYLQTLAHTLSGQFVLQANSPELYLKNNLYIDAGWKNVESTIAGSFTTGQHAEKPLLNIANSLQAVKRIKNRIFTVSSNSRIDAGRPQSLLVETGGKRYLQDVSARAFQSVSEASYGWIFGQWQVRGRAGIDYNHRKLESNLAGIHADGFPLTNDSRLDVLNLYVRPEIVYENKRLRIGTHASMNYYRYCFDGKTPDEHTSKSFGMISPSLSLRYKFTARMEMFMNARYMVTPPKAGVFYRGIIMSNYRELNAGYPSYSVDTERSAALSLRYRNPISSVFANAVFKYEKNSYSLIATQVFTDSQILTTFAPTANSGDTYSLNGGFSKGIFSGKIYTGIDMGYAQTKTAAMRNANIIQYKLSLLSVTPKVKGTVLKWIAVEYAVSASRNTMDFINDNSHSSYINVKQKLDISLFPTRKIQACAGIEHYSAKFNGNTDAGSLLLLDAGAKWKISDKFDLSLSATNLMNDVEYRYSRHATLSETVYTYRIRPRNIMMSIQMKF